MNGIALSGAEAGVALITRARDSLMMMKAERLTRILRQFTKAIPSRLLAGALWIFLGLWAGTAGASTHYVPNASFESPVTPYAGPNIDSWQKAPKPFWYDEAANGPWVQLAGNFLNTPQGSPGHIDNCDGAQAAFLFALPQVALFQDYNTTDWANPTPTHAFNAKFEVGQSYTLTVGVIGGGGGMTNGVTLDLSLYYRDSASNMVPVATTTVTNTPTTFPNTTHLVDFQAQLPAVKATDPWAGQNIGVQLASTVGFGLVGGYWDVDNVRLISATEPVLVGIGGTNGQFSFTLKSEPGLKFEVLATGDPTTPVAGWTSLGTLTNVTGSTAVVDPTTNLNTRFYQTRRLP